MYIERERDRERERYFYEGRRLASACRPTRRDAPARRDRDPGRSAGSI